jgi:hypothetical protein
MAAVRGAHSACPIRSGIVATLAIGSCGSACRRAAVTIEEWSGAFANRHVMAVTHGADHLNGFRADDRLEPLPNRIGAGPEPFTIRRPTVSK